MFDPQRETDCAARFLDVHHPGWFERINLAELDLESCTACVIGQAIAPCRQRYSWIEEMGIIFGEKHPDIITDHEQRKQRFGFSSTAFAANAYKPFWEEEVLQRRASFVLPTLERSTDEDSAVDPVLVSVGKESLRAEDRS